MRVRTMTISGTFYRADSETLTFSFPCHLQSLLGSEFNDIHASLKEIVYFKEPLSLRFFLLT